jgi:hypothetical protein
MLGFRERGSREVLLLIVLMHMFIELRLTSA